MQFKCIYCVILRLKEQFSYYFQLFGQIIIIIFQNFITFNSLIPKATIPTFSISLLRSSRNHTESIVGPHKLYLSHL